jgi:hypothetical protein
MCEGLHLRGQGGVCSQNVQLLDNGSIIVLVRLAAASLAPEYVCLFVQVQCPFVHQTYILPEKVGRMAV